jgi:hypothetical protein
VDRRFPSGLATSAGQGGKLILLSHDSLELKRPPSLISKNVPMPQRPSSLVGSPTFLEITLFNLGVFR